MPPSNKPINEICFSQIVDFVIVPFTCDLFSFKGYTNIMDTAEEARQYNPNLNIIGIYIARYNNNSLGDQYIKNNLQEFEDIFIDIQIPDRTDIRDSIMFGRPISYYKTFSPSKTAYEKLTAYMEERITQLRKGI
jgi:cellulose biosynthesis protein BcsQ